MGMIVAACCRLQGAATPRETHFAHRKCAATCVFSWAITPFVTPLMHNNSDEVFFKKTSRNTWPKRTRTLLTTSTIKFHVKKNHRSNRLLTTSGGDGAGGVGPGFGGFGEVFTAYEGSMLIPHNPNPLLSSFKFRWMRRKPSSPQRFPHEFFTIQ